MCTVNVTKQARLYECVDSLILRQMFVSVSIESFKLTDLSTHIMIDLFKPIY